jgi:hypothetical protein
MGASPEWFREVGGSRIAAASIFLPKACGHRTGACVFITVYRRFAAMRFAFGEQTTMQGQLLRPRDVASVQ